MRRVTFFLVLFSALLCSAQQFDVRSFKLLQNDITAWVNPIRDLNQEACALVKVTGGKDFSFATPLGIVKRSEEVGETWLYVPRGTILITVKHPRWGVLRDYKFPQPLESRMVYEMLLALPQEQHLKESTPSLRIRDERADECRVKFVVIEKEKKEVPKEPWLKLVMLSAETDGSVIVPGIRVGTVRRHGFYLAASSNFVSSSAEWECHDDGSLTDDGSTPYYRNAKRYACGSVLLGGMHRLSSRLYMYEGVGLGKQQLFWETNEGVKVKNVDAAYQGLAAETGVMYRWNSVLVSAGVSTLKAQLWRFSLGVGVCF